jgi:hypothetical protein
MEVITDKQIDQYFSGLSIDEKVALLPKELREPFCQDILKEVYEPYWNRMKNSQKKTPPLTNGEITAGREKLMREQYFPNERYRESLIISMLIGNIPVAEKAQFEEDSLRVFKEEWHKSKGSSGPKMQEVREVLFREKYPDISFLSIK